MPSGALDKIKLPRLPNTTRDQLTSGAALATYKAYLASGEQVLIEAFERKVSVRHLIAARSLLVDGLLQHVFDLMGCQHSNLCLVAVGGYGRSELHPQSDIDLLFLYQTTLNKRQQEQLESMISLLWDIGLTVGHSVRSLAECQQKAEEDITIVTNLIESRIVVGDRLLFEQMREMTSPEAMWPARQFFDAKIAEQKARYRKYKGTSFDLEPNLKSNPGGLRDIQLVGWVAKRYFNVASLQSLVTSGVFRLSEYRSLMSAQIFLWRVRFALHIITKRGDDRLLFQYQKQVAEYLGFEDTQQARAVEQLMKKFFRAAITIRNLSELLLQVFEEEILESDSKITPIDENFQLENDRISLIQPDAVRQDPTLILRTFITAANIPGNKHVSAKTLRAIRENRDLIDDKLRRQPEHQKLLLQFFSIRHTGDRPLFLIKRNGILARYIPAFEAISGQMQFDMFHSYTVDEHTIFLLKNLSRFAATEYQAEFPLCSDIMQKLDKPQIIFLAGLFHDIAKGRGGDHSELGAADALEFCRKLRMDDEDAETIAWLVKSHLIMSVTAQRKDISNPSVIADFADKVRTKQRLELLYILTVADIRATSAKLWNSWKDALLRELLISTTRYLDAENQPPISDSSHIEQSKRQALKKLKQQKVSISDTEKLWSSFDDIYFKNTPVERITWQTSSIIKHAKRDAPLVEIKRHPNNAGSEIYIYCSNRPGLFAAITRTLSQKNLMIQTAQLYTSQKDYCLDSFVVLEENGKPIQSSSRIQSIRKLLLKNLKNIDGMSKKIQRYTSKKIEQFHVETKINFLPGDNSPYTQIELITLDQPGLLAKFGDIIKDLDFSIHSAHIVTLGEKVEDSFEVSNAQQLPLTEQEQRLLQSKLLNSFNQ
ncbi:MAG: [protein-PII] uridylyltransferase [Kangiellaceae bacterium]|jgi:[protein-PII] uridylyltransferase|nr:[protein-PII] uridylyltransferase [Kangiellaceae bacterium]